MPKYTVVGDLHIKPDNLEKHEQLFRIIEELGNPTILLGDLLHTKELVRSRCFNFLFQQLAKSKLKFICLVGNHDWHNLECKEHSLEPLKSLPNVQIIDSPTTLPIYIDGARRYHLGFVPYLHNPDDFKASLQKLNININQPRAIFIHQGITGFDYGNGYIAEHETDFETLSEVNRVISGHFHKFQYKQPLIYLGTPFTQDFGEANQAKFLAVYDSDNDQIEYLQTDFPMHKSLTLSAEKAQVQLRKLLNDRDYFRCILTGTPEEIAAFDKAQFPGVKFIERPSVVKTEAGVISEVDSNPKKFRKWGEQVKGLPVDVIELGLKFLQEAE